MPADTNAVAAAVQAVTTQSPNEAPVAASELKTEPAKNEQFEAFARKEKQLHKMRKEIEAQNNELKQKLAQYETGYIPKARISDDPLSVLSEAGVTYEKLTEMLMSPLNSNDPTIRALKAQINSLIEKQTKAEQAAAEEQTKRYQHAITQIGNEVKQAVASNEAFETIREMGMEDAVTELIEQTFTNEGILLDTDEACKQVEEHLLTEAERMSKLKKLQARLQPKAPEATEAKPTQSQQLKTLTNAVSAAPTKRLSEKERIERAMAAFNGKLT